MEFLLNRIKEALADKGSVGVSTLVELKEYCRTNKITNSQLEKLIQEETEKHKALTKNTRAPFERKEVKERTVFSREDYNFKNNRPEVFERKSTTERATFKPREEFLRQTSNTPKKEKKVDNPSNKDENKTQEPKVKQEPKKEKVNFTKPENTKPEPQKTKKTKSEKFVDDFEFEERIQSKVNQQNEQKVKSKAKRKAKKTETYSAIMNEEINKFQKYIFIAIIAGFIIPFIPIVAGFYLKGKVSELKEGHNYLYLNNVDKKRVDMTLNLCYIAIGVGFFMLIGLKNFL